jgi:hypothetical protein
MQKNTPTDQNPHCADAALLEHLWTLFGSFGGARSAGWRSHWDQSKKPQEHPEPGSGRIIAFGYIDATGKRSSSVVIRNAQGQERHLLPATKENVGKALIEMGITDTEWSS